MTAVYTYQISQWRRLASLGIPLIDSTVKTGDYRLCPTWPMVLGVKKGHLSERSYTEQYHAILNHWWFADPDYFDQLLRYPHVAFGCYCPPGHFCHRYLLVDFLTRHTHTTYLGELPQCLSNDP